MIFLIIEDDAFSQLVMQEMLKLIDPDCRMLIADNGMKALEILKTEKVSMIFCDVNMPVMNGEELIRNIRHEQRLDIPVICTTAHAMVGDREKLLFKGFTDYLSKPVNLGDLRSLIQAHRQPE